MQRHHAIGRRPVGHTFINESEDDDCLDVIPLGAIYFQPFTITDTAGAIVAQQMYPRRLVVGSEILAQCLDRAFTAIVEAEQAT